MPGFLIDGSDAALVHRICGEALERARAGGGPTLIESVTMRAVGHSVYDKFADYVDMENFERWTKERDPIACFDEFLAANELASPEEIAGSHARARAEAEAAREEALKSPFPAPESVTDGVFAG